MALEYKVKSITGNLRIIYPFHKKSPLESMLAMVCANGTKLPATELGI